MQLYNTPTKHIETVQPLNDNQVSVYTCGPTVYDYPHIGNWFTFIRYDVLIRALKISGYNPNWVMNITDVGHLVSDADDGEDKLEKGAKREGKNAWDVAAFYGDYFLNGLERLNITPPTTVPKATDHIAEQIELVKKLEEKGFTYIIADGVYFDTSTFPNYAKFAGLDLEDQQAGARVEYNTEKRNPSDFALWKFSPKSQHRDMEWESPWGVGFPGWHLECSAMAIKYLGETIDIHAGGIDHIPVHHTNEIAQSEAATGKTFSKYWMHTNHITINGKKISKSLGNTITLDDIEAKGFSLEAFRLYVLESHYRTQSKFTWEGMEAARNRLKHWYEVAALKWQTISTQNIHDISYYIGTVDSDIRASLLDDLNTPHMLANIDARFSEIEKELVSAESLPAFTKYLEAIDEVTGLHLNKQLDITNEQKQLIAARETARAEKDWAKSDELRDQLAEQGVGLRDTANGAIWHRL